ncbi:site-2 protease family protein, partial [Candidatus Woesearchaeota archaeon]|nr:site-2 protease family protein [Candidatus Woesearchaeota archaeon]
YEPEGISFNSVQEGFPAEQAGLKPGEIYTSFNGAPLKTVNDLAAEIEEVEVGEKIVISSETNSYELTAAESPTEEGRPYIGVIGLYTRFNDDNTFLFKSLKWINSLLVVIFILSFGIGMANLLPVGPLDGGRMFNLAMQKIRGPEKGLKIWTKVSLFFLLLILFLLTPIFRSTLQAILGAFS